MFIRILECIKKKIFDKLNGRRVRWTERQATVVYHRIIIFLVRRGKINIHVCRGHGKILATPLSWHSGKSNTITVRRIERTVDNKQDCIIVFNDSIKRVVRHTRPSVVIKTCRLHTIFGIMFSPPSPYEQVVLGIFRTQQTRLIIIIIVTRIIDTNQTTAGFIDLVLSTLRECYRSYG